MALNLPSQPPPLILASTSPYRRALLERFYQAFEVVDPGVDEKAVEGETPLQRAVRLALSKAAAVADKHHDHIVIGADQVACLEGVVLGKPLSHDRAEEQLHRMSGKKVLFYSAVAVLCRARDFAGQDVATVEVQMRELNDWEITRYVLVERPLDCAGSAKSEGLGIALTRSIMSDDPTALIGLPLIRTAELLRQAGLPLP